MFFRYIPELFSPGQASRSIVSIILPVRRQYTGEDGQLIELSIVHTGFTQQTDKLEFGGPSERVIPNQFSFLVRESPSNYRLPIVIHS